MITRALIVGGANGMGLAMAMCLVKRDVVEKVYVVDKAPLSEKYQHEKITSFCFDLTTEDYSLFDQFSDVDALIVTAGFGRLSLFKDLPEQHIADSFHVNTIPVMRLVKKFYPQLSGEKDFYCGVMVSIAGFMSSPFLSVYGATKAALKIFIESVNVELLKGGSKNQILNVSPGSIKGTSFNAGTTDLELTTPLAIQILEHLEREEDLFIPQYEEVFEQVLKRYHDDFRKEGAHSYDYKLQSGRVKND